MQPLTLQLLRRFSWPDWVFGETASFSAQVQTLVTMGCLAWTTLCAAGDLLLGLGVSLVLVHVVNPQSFHWTMDMILPWTRLLALCAAQQNAVRSVKEDW